MNKSIKVRLLHASENLLAYKFIDAQLSKLCEFSQVLLLSTLRQRYELGQRINQLLCLPVVCDAHIKFI